MDGIKNEKWTVRIEPSRLEGKLAYAKLTGRYEGIGEELVILGLNELAVKGGRGVSCFVEGVLASEQVKKTIEDGVKGACGKFGCAYLGTKWAGQVRDKDQTALSASFVGERENQIKGSAAAGDLVLGVKSNGVHTAGFSVIKKLFAVDDRVLMEAFDKQFLSTAEEELLKPTKAYAESLLALFPQVEVKATAIVDEGGLTGAVKSVLPEGCGAELIKASYETPRLFRVMKLRAGLDDEKAYSTFTMGVGLVLIVAEKDVKNALKAFGDEAVLLGNVVAGSGVRLG